MLFRDIDWGRDDAKSDTRLAEYFLRTPEYEQVRTGRAAFVIGRKGTGKTAICQMIDREAQHSANTFAALLSFKSAPTSDLYLSSDSAFKAPNQYISIWKFLIALEASKLILRDESIEGDARETLDEFLRENFGSIDVACLDAVSTLRRKSWKLGLTLPVHHLPGGELTREASALSLQQIHYGRAAASLLALLKDLQSENEFFLLFDDLDEDYRKEPTYFDLTSSLLKAVYQVRQEMRGGLKLWPIVVLHEDIHAQLDDRDLNKMRELTVYLRWRSDPSRHREFGLRGLVNERIRASLEADTGPDFWPLVVAEDGWKGPGGAWRYIVDRTMNRPRDLILALKFCQPFEAGLKLTRSAIRAAESDYSEWLYNEIRDELFRELPDYREAFGLLTRIGASFTIDVWRSEFAKDEVLSSKYSRPDQVLEMLYQFSVIGVSKRGAILFKYKTPHVTFDKGALFTVHKGLQRHLVIGGRKGQRRSH